MNWDQYKALCDSPNVLSRWMLEQTRELLDDDRLGQRLHDALSDAPVEKPVDHRGGVQTDMFVLALTVDEARGVWESVQAAVARGVTTRATRARGLGGFVEAWGEYVQYLERRQPDAGRDCSPRS